MFEFIAIRIEMEKTALSKELSEKTSGRIKELSELLALFSSVKLPTE